MVRIKSILRKFKEQGGEEGDRCLAPVSADEKALMMSLSSFAPVIEGAWKDLAPHRICAFIYQIANDFNKFYHGTKIISEEDKERQRSWIALIKLTLKILETSIDLLGFEAPEAM
jgi:arginyl-tRNA synthetase